MSTATAVPSHVIPQASMRATLADLYHLEGRRLDALGVVFDNACVNSRRTVVPLEDLGTRRSFAERNLLYGRHAVPLALQAATRCLDQAGVRARDVDLLVVVSCTGVMQPSLAVQLARALGLRTDTRLLPISSLGCLAGAAALARACEGLADEHTRTALVVAVELSSLNFQGDDHRQANLISSALFGDGAGAALLVTGEHAGAQVITTGSHQHPHSLDMMGFEMADDGLHMILSREVPEVIGANIAHLVDALLEGTGLDRAHLAWFALHPGGRKVLTHIEEALGLTSSQTSASWEVLRQYGNVSSATVMFVLDHKRRHDPPASGAYGLLAGFGPGLSSETLLLRWAN